MTNGFVILLILSPLLFIISLIGFINIFDYIADSDIWVHKEDRDK